MATQQVDPGVVAVYQSQTTTLRDQLAAFIAALWASLVDYRAASMVGFTAQVVPVVEGAMAHMQAITSAYLATVAGRSGPASTPAAFRSLGVSDVRAGADPLDVYGRPFHLVWRRLHDLAPLDGPKIEQAIRSGEDRAIQLAVTDVQLAKTRTAQQVITDSPHIVGYRRVLEGPRSCGLCIVASTQRYHKKQLMPIHPGCDCSIEPITGADDGERLIAPDVLAAAHQAVADRFGTSSSAADRIRGALTDKGGPVLYRDVLITHDHHEIGPVLSVRGQRWAKVPAAQQ